jgi:hypothetical protein
VGKRKAFVASYAIAATGAFLITMVSADGYVVAVFVLIAKFGISFAYNLIYLVTPTLFPAEYGSTAFGICNASAMFFSIFSAVIAEFPAPMPMISYGITSLFALVASMFLNTNVKYE